MDELIKSFNNDQDKYEFLLFERDTVRKEAEQILIRYKIEFGSQIIELFEAKTLIIRYKKMIAYYQRALSGNGQINMDKLEKELDRDMKVYYDKIKEMLMERDALDDAVELTPHESKRVKELYHVLAKKIHPDLNPALADNPVIADLWAQIKTAYIHNDTKALAELTVQVNKVLKDLEMQGFTDLEIPDIEEKIEELEREISKTKSTSPYTYNEFLVDDDAIESKHNEIQKEIDECNQYADKLQAVIDRMVKEGGITLIWMEN